MKSELIVDVSPDEVSFALLEDSRLMSLQKEGRNIAYAVGDIYLARVKKLMPGLNAAFVNVGYEKDAFLHYLDLGAHFASYNEFLTQLLGKDRRHVPQVSKMTIKPDIDKHGSIADVLQPGKEILVQIAKEPISSKGPRLTTEINFTGRYLVLIPFSDKISISQKIKSSEEKLRLRRLIESIKPKNFGVIIRTSAEGKRVAELIHEMKTLTRYWEEMCEKAQKTTAPALVFEEESRVVAMLRDIFNPSFEAIHVNDQATYQSIRNYVSLIAPERQDIVQLYDKPLPIFDSFGVTRQIKSSFGKTVSFKSGAYIIIEHTEALHVIDVNSGNRTKATNDQETNALEVNLRAADEIARQLRLRDMGGIIVIDFIDMAKNEHRQQLFEHMKEIMANDRARHNILPLSKFGLMQITRQRVRPALDVQTEETCPSCHGTGIVQPSLLFTDTLLEKIEYVASELNIKSFRVYVHPYVDAYLKKGWLFSMSMKWRRSVDAKFKIYPDESLGCLEYRVVDANGNVLDLKQEKDVGASTAEKTKNKAAKRIGDDGTIDISMPTSPRKVSASSMNETTAKQPEAQCDNTSKSDKPDKKIAMGRAISVAEPPAGAEVKQDNLLGKNSATTAKDSDTEPVERKTKRSMLRKPQQKDVPAENVVAVLTEKSASEEADVSGISVAEKKNLPQTTTAENTLRDETTDADNDAMDDFADGATDDGTAISQKAPSRNRRSRNRSRTKVKKAENDSVGFGDSDNEALLDDVVTETQENSVIEETTAKADTVGEAEATDAKAGDEKNKAPKKRRRGRRKSATITDESQNPDNLTDAINDSVVGPENNNEQT